jgi:peptide/nickel transport system substrate-binding protein
MPKKLWRVPLLGVVTLGLGLAACGSPSASGNASPGSGVSTDVSGGTATFNLVSAPDSLDPEFAYTSESEDALWLCYTGLLTYRHANGPAGTQLIPGLAAALPQVSDGGTVYTLTLRKGLKFSNGTPVVASDFPFTIERAIKVNWGGDSFFTSYIAGAAAYAEGKASGISGIKTDDATGQISIKLTSAYGAFANVLAFPSAGLVPKGSPMTVQNTSPPPGVGPYKIANVVPNQSFELVKNPKFAPLHIPNIPLGHLDTITFNVVSNPVTAAEEVLNNTVDGFDPNGVVPASVLVQIRSRASSRFSTHGTPTTTYFFLNTKSKPFSNKLAREAANYALNRNGIERLSSGAIEPGCYFFPPNIVGHLNGCMYTGPGGSDLSKAKALVRQAGLEGYPVTVWGENTPPRSNYVQYYASALKSIGFNVQIKLIDQSIYGTVIGSLKNNPQTGDGEWGEDFPNPSDFMLPLGSAGIPATNNLDYSQVTPPANVQRLVTVPATRLSSLASQWQAVDTYVAANAEEVVYGYQVDPEFLSDRIDLAKAVFSPIYLDDFSTWELHKS